MIIRANNEMAHKMAEAGIQFERICSDWYLLDAGITFEQVNQAGLMIKAIR